MKLKRFTKKILTVATIGAIAFSTASYAFAAVSEDDTKNLNGSSWTRWVGTAKNVNFSFKIGNPPSWSTSYLNRMQYKDPYMARDGYTRYLARNDVWKGTTGYTSTSSQTCHRAQVRYGSVIVWK